MHCCCRFFAAFFVILAVAAPARAAFVDNINGSATPGSNGFESIYFASNGQGWFYTPAFSYTLTGIYTDYGPSNGSLFTPEITAQLQTDRPVNGGTVLTEGTFQANSAAGGVVGASVGPINLVAGQTYFVDLLNDFGMGVNEGQWQSVGGVPTPSNGATVNLGTEYYDLLPSTGFSNTIGSGAYASFFGSGGFPTVMISGAEPILLFAGVLPASIPAAVPEPSSIALLAAGLVGLLAIRRRRA